MLLGVVSSILNSVPPMSAGVVFLPGRSPSPWVQSQMAPNMSSAVREHLPVVLLGGISFPAFKQPAATAVNFTVSCSCSGLLSLVPGATSAGSWPSALAAQVSMLDFSLDSREIVLSGGVSPSLLDVASKVGDSSPGFSLPVYFVVSITIADPTAIVEKPGGSFSVTWALRFGLSRFLIVLSVVSMVGKWTTFPITVSVLH